MKSRRVEYLLDKLNADIEKSASPRQIEALRAAKTPVMINEIRLNIPIERNVKQLKQNELPNHKERVELERALENFRRSNAKMPARQTFNRRQNYAQYFD